MLRKGRGSGYVAVAKSSWKGSRAYCWRCGSGGGSVGRGNGRRRIISARGERTGGVVVSGGGSVAEDESAVAVCRRGGSRKKLARAGINLQCVSLVALRVAVALTLVYRRGGVASDDSRERDGGASVGVVHAVAVGVAARAMDGGASMMGFLLPSFSRRDNLVKYD